MSNPVPNNLALSVINTNDTAQSAPLRNNYAAIQTAVNQLIACLSGGTAGQRLQAVDGTDVQWVNQITYRKTSSKAVSNTVAETDLLNSEITVGAGVLGTTGALRLTALGNLINTSGATQALPRFKLKLGATTLLDTGAPAAAWVSSATQGAFRIQAEIMNTGAANAQSSSLSVNLADSLSNNIFATPTTGSGIYGTGANDTAVSVLWNNTAVDTTAAQALALSVILPAANASLGITLTAALVEII